VTTPARTSLKDQLESDALFYDKNQPSRRNRLNEMMKGRNVSVNPNTYLVDESLNVDGWVPSNPKDPNYGKAFVTPAEGGANAIGHEQFHQQYKHAVQNGMPLPTNGSPESNWLNNQVRDKVNALKRQKYNFGEASPFALNMQNSPEEYYANLVGLEGMQSKGVQLKDTYIGKQLLDTPESQAIYDYYKTGHSAGPMEPPQQAINRALNPPQPPSMMDRIMAKIQALRNE